MALMMYTLLVFHSQPEMDLEIYTNNDIYHIRGLRVTSEVSPEVYYFNSNQELKQFISKVTSNQIK